MSLDISNKSTELNFGTSVPALTGSELDNDTFFITTNGLPTGTITETWKFDAQSNAWFQIPTSAPTPVVANNDLGYNGGILQTGYPLVRDTSTTGAYYRHWINTNNGPDLPAGTGMIHGVKNSMRVGYWLAAPTGFGTLGSGYRNEIPANYSSAFGYQNEVRATYSQATGFRNQISGSYGLANGANNQILSGNYNFYNGNGNIGQTAGSLVTGNNNGTVASPLTGSYSLWAGNSHLGTSSYSGIIGNNHSSTGNYNMITGNGMENTGTGIITAGSGHDTSGSYNRVDGLNHIVSSSYNGVSGYLHRVSSFGNLVGGYRQTVTGNRSLSVGDQNSVAGTGHGVIGFSHIVLGNYNVVMGHNHTVDAGSYLTLLGRNNRNRNGSYSYAIGFSHDLRGTCAGAIGYNHTFTTDSNYSIMIGRSNIVDGGRDKIFIGRGINVVTPNDSVIICGSNQRLGFFEGAGVTKQNGAAIVDPAVRAIFQAYNLTT